MFTSPKLLLILLASASSGVLSAPLDTEAVAAAGRFVVTLKPNAAVDLDLHARWVADVHARNLRRRGDITPGLSTTFSFNDFAGYAGAFDDDTLEAIRANVNVRTQLRSQAFQMIEMQEQLTTS